MIMPLVEADRDINVPNLERYRVLMYLLSTLGELNSKSIKNLADEFKTDAESENYRAVGDIVRDITHDRTLFRRDPFLNHVALSYGLEELSVEVDPGKPMLPRSDGKPHSLLDGLVGDGPVRPVLIDLYNLPGLGLAGTKTDETDYSHTFYPSSSAQAHTKTLRLLFGNLEPQMRRSNSIVLVEQYTQQLIPA